MQVTGNKTSQSYSLSIRLRTDGFSFFLNNPSSFSFLQKEDYTVTADKAYAQRLQQALQTSALTQKELSDVHVLTCTPATRIPLDYFRKDEAEALYRLTFPQTDINNQSVFYNILPQLEIVEINSIAKDVEQVLQERYNPILHLNGLNSCLLETLKTYEEQQPDTTRRLYACFREQEMLLLCFGDRKLAFANSYDIAATANAVYYLLYIWKLLGLNPLEDECVLINSRYSPSVQEALGAYLRHVDELSPLAVFPQLPQTGNTDIPFDVLALLLKRN